MSTTLTRLLPLLLLLILLSIIGFIAYATYTVATAVKTQTEKRMEKKHVVMTKDGMRVGVKEVGREGYVDRTQRYVVFFFLLCFGFGLAIGVFVWGVGCGM